MNEKGKHKTSEGIEKHMIICVSDSETLIIILSSISREVFSDVIWWLTGDPSDIRVHESSMSHLPSKQSFHREIRIIMYTLVSRACELRSNENFTKFL
jgi:hypothetical protein